MSPSPRYGRPKPTKVQLKAQKAEKARKVKKGNAEHNKSLQGICATQLPKKSKLSSLTPVHSYSPEVRPSAPTYTTISYSFVTRGSCCSVFFCVCLKSTSRKTRRHYKPAPPAHNDQPPLYCSGFCSKLRAPHWGTFLGPFVCGVRAFPLFSYNFGTISCFLRWKPLAW